MHSLNVRVVIGVTDSVVVAVDEVEEGPIREITAKLDLVGCVSVVADRLVERK